MVKYTHNDAYSEGWNDATKEMEAQIAELKAENYRMSCFEDMYHDERLLNIAQAANDKIGEKNEKILQEQMEKLKDDKKKLKEWVDRNQVEIDRLRLTIDEEEDSLPFGVMAWNDNTEEDLFESDTLEKCVEYIKNMGDDRDDYENVVVFDRNGYHDGFDNSDTITILYKWEDDEDEEIACQCGCGADIDEHNYMKQFWTTKPPKNHPQYKGDEE